ncbi:MAG: cyclic nucleotide-binding domain-containing protein [Candidatus Paceibacterota bacterium]
MESITHYLKRYSLAEILSADLIDSIRLLRSEAGEFLIKKGEKVDYLRFFVEGKAKVYSRMENGSSLLVRFYKPFDILGDVELFAYERFILDVEAVTTTVCLAVGVDTIKRAAERNGPLLMYLCERLGRKLADFNSTAAINLRYPVENRFASYLLAAADEEDSGLSTDDLGELADILGSSYRQLARVVRHFREEGILDAARGRIRVLDVEALRPLARDLYI